MKEIFLVAPRDKSTPAGVFGEFRDADGRHICVSLERPWLNNLAKKSCIPAGVYICSYFKSPTKGEVYLLDRETTKPRDMIEIHPANVYTELEGCIAPGLDFAPFWVDKNDELPKHSGLPAVKKIQGVISSIRAREILRVACDWPNPFKLTII